jgi:DNA-directed RNA polymerase subunit RPC12/RpoP
MADKQTYECIDCGKKTEVADTDAKTPECCGKPMQKVAALDACTLSSTAEHSRFDDISEPCDDGRSGT